MSFKDWLFTKYPEESKTLPWGLGHVLTLLACICFIVIIFKLFKNKDKSTKRKLLWFLVAIILLFEIARRVINLLKTTDYSLNNLLSILLPRPWCAISCWALILCAIFNKKFLYNFACIISLLGSVAFFAYPGVGFKSPYFLFDDLYSVVTHCMLLITSISLMSLGFVSFRYKKIWKVLGCFAIVILYALLEVYVLKIENDPMYFMPNGDIQNVLGIDYRTYLISYITFLFVYVNAFFVVYEIKRKRRKKSYLIEE